APHRVRGDVHGDHEVACRPAVRARSALAAQPDLLAVVDAGGDPRVQGTAVDLEVGRRPLDRRAERQGHLRRDVGALARRREPGRAVALPASAAAEHRAEDVLEARARRAAALRVPHAGTAPRAAPTEHGAHDVLEAACPGAPGARGETGAPGHGAHGVVLPALLRVGQDRVGLADLLELGLRVRLPLVLVGVVLAGELAVGLLHR